MTFEAQRAAIEQRFKAAWTATPVAWPNVAFTPPDPPAPWVRLHIQDAMADQVSLGPTSLDRYSGVVYIMIFVVLGQGLAEARRLADLAAPIFRKQIFDGVTCAVPYLRDIGPDAPFYHVNLLVPFLYDAVE